MSAQAIGLGNGNHLSSKPQRGGSKLDGHGTPTSTMTNQRIGPPRWGFLLVVVIVTQADGLGWHKAATLWRKTEV